VSCSSMLGGCVGQHAMEKWLPISMMAKNLRSQNLFSSLKYSFSSFGSTVP
jgi:hypothetical protein